jgi:hypothetical protein
MFDKAWSRKSKNISIIIFLSIAFIFVFLILFKNLNTFEQKQKDTRKKELENRINPYRELEERAKALKKLREILEEYLKELESRLKELEKSKPDLLYRYEPYYIYEGWNYTEKYTPEVARGD